MSDDNKRFEALDHAGNMLSNIAFNLGQRSPGQILTADDISALKAAQRQWDAERAYERCRAALAPAASAQAEPTLLGEVVGSHWVGMGEMPTIRWEGSFWPLVGQKLYAAPTSPSADLVLVPREPTIGMMEAALETMRATGMQIDPPAHELHQSRVIYRAMIEAAAAPVAAPVDRPPYPEGDVVGPCVCGSWPGGKCLRCEWRPAQPSAASVREKP